MDTIFNLVKPLFHKHKNAPHVEMEFRLGNMHNNMFDTNVGSDIFHRIMEGLEQYKDWEKKTIEETSVYYKNTLRYIINEETEETMCINKIPVVKETVRLHGLYPFDVRFAISSEVPCEHNPEEVMENSKSKKRYSFVRKNLSIDMTIISGQSDDLDCEDESLYQVELEIIDPLAIKTDQELYNIVHKIHCILILLNT